MILASDLASAGKVNKTHGIGGELSISFSADAPVIEPGECLIMSIDGILTPFFAETVRPRSSEALLVKLDGVDSQEEAAQYVGHEIFMPKSLMESEEADDMDDEDGFYASDLIGFEALDDEGESIGRIADIDEATENVLFVVERPDGKVVYIPVADEFITEISTQNQNITFDLPEGLLLL